MKVDQIPVGEFEWTDDYSFHRILSCKNHLSARYMTKNTFYRSLHVVKLPDGDIERTDTGECTCPFADLVVIESNDGS